MRISCEAGRHILVQPPVTNDSHGRRPKVSVIRDPDSHRTSWNGVTTMNHRFRAPVTRTISLRPRTRVSLRIFLRICPDDCESRQTRNYALGLRLDTTLSTLSSTTLEDGSSHFQHRRFISAHVSLSIFFRFILLFLLDSRNHILSLCSLDLVPAFYFGDANSIRSSVS